MTTPGRWSAQAERAGFSSVGVIDRLIYENLDPLVALAAVAACTSHVELVTTVVNVCWRGNARADYEAEPTPADLHRNPDATVFKAS